MKKFLGFVFCLIAFASSAQLKIGINAGYNMAQFDAKGANNNWYDLSAVNGYQVGLIAEQQLAKRFFLNLAVDFNHKGGVVNMALTQAGTNYTMTLNYLQIPLGVDYKIPISKSSKLIVGAGLYGALGLSGKKKGTMIDNNGVMTNIDKNVEFSNNTSNTDIYEVRVKPIDLGYVFNAGIEWKKFQFKLNYVHGFGNTKPLSTPKFENLTYGISVAYLLPW